MTRGTLRGRWVREVYRTPIVTDSVKVLLLALADSMAENGYVSVPRTALADKLNKSPRRIQERFDTAVKAGLLSRVTKGAPGITAVYQALVPAGRTDRVRSTSSKPFARHLPKPEGTEDADGADVRPNEAVEGGADVRPNDMGRFLAPVDRRSSALSGHAQHGADDRPAKGKNTGTAADRAACEPGTTQQRNDSGSDQPARLHRAVAVDRVDGAA